MSYEGKGAQILSVITGYRTCDGAIRTASLGSTFHREYSYFRQKGEQRPNPRARFWQDLKIAIKDLQDRQHSILLMLDANSTLASDTSFRDMVQDLGLNDLHAADPASSTFIGKSDRRIDYMLGCQRTLDALSRQGSLSYFEGPQSDHRGLYVDLNLKQLFGVDVADIQLAPAQLRPLRTGNPELVITYNENMHSYYEAHAMKERIDRLYDTHQTLSNAQVRSLLTSWDNDQGRAMTTAEAKLRIPPKPHQWSPELRNSAVLMRYWRLRLREVQHGEEYTTTFTRWEMQIQEQDPGFHLPSKDTRLSLETIRTHLNQATKTFRKIQASSTDHRMKSYHDLLANYDADINPTTKKESKRKAKVVNRTILSEGCRRIYGAIRNIMKPSEFSALAKVKVPRPVDDLLPTPPGEVHSVLASNLPKNLIWDTVISQDEIENRLLQFNRASFRAAAESPCGHGVIHDALTFSSLSPAAEEMLKGSVPEE